MIARSLGLPASTIEYRIRRLESSGVISGDMHEVQGEQIGLNNHIILIGMQGIDSNRHQQFYRFVKTHPNITHFSFGVGHWDYMLGVAVYGLNELTALVDYLRKQLGADVATVKTFSMFRAWKVRDYPSLADRWPRGPEEAKSE